MFRLLKNERGNWTLIGLLVGVAVGVTILVVVLLPHISPEGRTRDVATDEGLVQPKEGQTILGASIDKGKQTACMSNLRQIRQMIEYTKYSSDPLPASLGEMKLGSASMCPASGQPYQYDPTTGAIRCNTPGHEGL